MHVSRDDLYAVSEVNKLYIFPEVRLYRNKLIIYQNRFVPVFRVDFKIFQVQENKPDIDYRQVTDLLTDLFTHNCNITADPKENNSKSIPRKF